MEIPFTELLKNEAQSTEIAAADTYLIKCNRGRIKVKMLLVNADTTTNIVFQDFLAEGSALTNGFRIYIKSRTYGIVDLTGNCTTTNDLLSSAVIESVANRYIQLSIKLPEFFLNENDEIRAELRDTLTALDHFTIRVIGTEYH